MILLLGVVVFSQETAAQKELLKRAEENFELINTNPEKAFIEAKEIGEEAQILNVYEAELRAIHTQCVYYKTKNDFEKMMITAKSLSEKAASYKLVVYEAIAKRYLFESYLLSGLPDKAYEEIKRGMVLIRRLDDKDSLNIVTKGDLLITYSNYYALKNDYQNKLKYIKLSGEEYKKLPEGKYRQRLLYVHYSNLAGVYNDLNIPDSAKYYALLSQSEDKDHNRSDVKFQNLFILGDLAVKEEDYTKSLSYFKEAEKLRGYQIPINIQFLYDNIILSYQKLELEDSVRLYESKRDSLKLSVSENQNKSLHNLLNEKESGNKKYNYTLLAFCALAIVIIFFVIRKNRVMAKQEKTSQQYLRETSGIQKEQDYSRLLEMFKKNDLAFITYFNEVYPDFSQKLIGINPKITQTEIEFSTYLKLKIPTKDIVRYRNLAHRTVQNKKYIIRKRLNIPKEIDIYQWFDGL